MSTRKLTLTALMAAVTAVLSYVIIPLPFSPVPVTGQTLGVMLAGLILGSVGGALSQAIYVLIGIAGLPVFAGGASGLGAIAGPTGGYIYGFIAGSFVTGWLSAKGRRKQAKPSFLQNLYSAIIGGIIVVYALGLVQLSLVAHLPLKKAILVGALPFIPGDVFKAIIAAYVSARFPLINPNRVQQR